MAHSPISLRRMHWPVCQAPDCTGARSEDSKECLEHLSSEQLASVLSGLREGQPLDARGTRISAGLLQRIIEHLPEDDNGGRIFNAASFAYAQFVGPAIFDGVSFARSVSFRGAHFSDRASFNQTRFERFADFQHADFVEPALFCGSVFRCALFQRVVFGADVSFAGAQFTRSAIFNGARFRDHASFDGATFHRPVDLRRARFEDGVSFDHTLGPPSAPLLEGTQFAIIPTGTSFISFGGLNITRQDGLRTITYQQPDRDRDRAGANAAGKVVDWLNDHYAVLVALLGVLIYGMVRGAHDAFYDRLGVIPEDVGATYALMVLRAAFGLGAYLLILIVIGSCLLFMVSLLVRTGAGGGRSLKEAAKLSAKHPSVLVALILLATLPLFLHFEGLDRWDRVVAVMGVRPGFWRAYLASLSIIALIIMIPPSYNWLARRVEYVAVGLLILLFAVLGFGILNFSSDWGALKGKDATAGEAVRPPVLYGIVGIQAHPVCVTWIGDDSEAPRINRPFMYLGQAHSFAVLYDYYRQFEERRAIRVPTSKVVLTSVDASRNPVVGESGVPDSGEPPLDCIAGKLTPPPTTTTTTATVTTTTSTLPPTAVASWVRSLMS